VNCLWPEDKYIHMVAVNASHSSAPHLHINPAYLAAAPALPHIKQRMINMDLLKIIHILLGALFLVGSHIRANEPDSFATVLMVGTVDALSEILPTKVTSAVDHFAAQSARNNLDDDKLVPAVNATMWSASMTFEAILNLSGDIEQTLA